MIYSIIDNGTVHKLKKHTVTHNFLTCFYEIEGMQTTEIYESGGDTYKSVVTHGYGVIRRLTGVHYLAYQTIIKRTREGVGTLVSSVWLLSKRTQYTEAQLRGDKHLPESDHVPLDDEEQKAFEFDEKFSETNFIDY